MARRPSFSEANTLTLLQSGAEYFPALLAALASATQEVLLETFILADDASGRRVMDALSRCAARGVRVVFTIDAVGSKDVDQAVLDELIQAGVILRVFNPLKWTRPWRALRRQHRKVCVVDGRVAFVGGINLIDDWNVVEGETPPRFDFAVKVEGPLVAQIRASARRTAFMLRALPLDQVLVREDARGSPPSGHLEGINRRVGGVEGANEVQQTAHGSEQAAQSGQQVAHSGQQVAHSGQQVAHSGARAALVVRDNLLNRRSIERAYLQALRGAKSHVVLANAYFLPSRKLMRALKDCAARGVAVRVLLQGPTDHPLMRLAAQALYRRLMNAGIEVREYSAAFLHAKVGVIDGRWATVGSSNFDPFSLVLAREANVVVEDAAFAQALERALILSSDAGSRFITAALLSRASTWTRLKQWAAYRFARLLAALLGAGAG